MNIEPEIVIKQDSSKSEDMPPNNFDVKREKRSNQNVTASKCAKQKIFFNDGIRSVDFVLVWDGFDEDSMTPEIHVKRQIFENNLMKEGLEIEYEPQEQNGLNFVKVNKKNINTTIFVV